MIGGSPPLSLNFRIASLTSDRFLDVVGFSALLGLCVSKTFSCIWLTVGFGSPPLVLLCWLRTSVFRNDFRVLVAAGSLQAGEMPWSSWPSET